MVNRVSLLFIASFFLIGCNKPTNQVETAKSNESIKKSEINKMNYEEKDAYDKEYFGNLREMAITEADFLSISRYVIEQAKLNNFKDIDLILGKKEYMITKDFNDPYSFYHYRHIPSHKELEVVLKYAKKGNKLDSIYFTPGGPIDFTLENSSINILEALKLKILKKEKLEYSNKLVEYQLTDGTFKYLVVAKDTGSEDNLPKEFYSFEIYMSKNKF